MGVGQILLGQLVEVMEDAIGGEPREHLSPQHAAQQAHQQAGGHPLAHHIAHHQGPAPLLTAAALELGPGGDEVVVVAPHQVGRPAAGRQLHPLDHRAVVRQQLGLDLGAGAELAIEAFMAAAFLEQRVVFQGNAGEVSHQLAMAPVPITPARAAGWAEHVKASPLATAGHHRGADQGSPVPMLGHHLIEASHQAGLTGRRQQAGVV